MNTVAYILYFSLTYFITVHTGLSFYRNGRIYILNLMEGNSSLADYINRVLLLGYYLLNLGYVALTISDWHYVNTLREVITTVGLKTGRIMLLLAYIHYVNMAIILLISRKQNTENHKP